MKTECDVAMAKKRKLLPCDNNCKSCFACIIINDSGDREHVDMMSKWGKKKKREGYWK